MSLTRRVLAWCREQGFPLEGGVPVLCAASGGPDSMCLLHLLWTLSRQGAVTLWAASFDHRLRPEGEEDLDLVRRWCREREIPFVPGGGDVAAFSQARGLTLEEGGRVLRYRFLEETAGALGCRWIATGHNAGDNAETLLFHLLRGTGLRGLGGIPPKRGQIIRPLLSVTREEILTYLEVHQVPWRTDGSNGDLRFTRNYLRHQVIPLLEEKNPSLAAVLGRTAESLRQDEDYLERETERVAQTLLRQEKGGVSVEAAALAALHPAIALRLVGEMAEMARPGTVLPWEQRRRVLELARGEDPSARLSLTNGLQAKRLYAILFLTGEQEKNSFSPVTLRPGERFSLPELGLEGFAVAGTCPIEGPLWGEGFLWLRGEAAGLTLRPRRTGDEISLPGRPPKRVKKLMIEQKIPREDRDRIPVVEADGHLAALFGMGVDRRWLPQRGKPALCLRWNGTDAKGAV